MWSAFDWREFDQPPGWAASTTSGCSPPTAPSGSRAGPSSGSRSGPGGPDRSEPDGPPLPEAMVSVTGGSPGDRWSEELAYLGLVAALRSPSRPVPARVVGVWPDAGATRVVAIDDASLIAAADLVIATVATLVDARGMAAAAG